MSKNHRRGFTPTELAVVIGVVTILTGLLLPALANPRGKGAAITCLGNLRRLIQAWALYSDDNNGRLVMNFHGAETYRGAVVTSNGGRNAPWAVGWIDWTTSADNTNVSYLIDPGFCCPQTATAWTDQPASYHEGAGSFAFADGHVELKKWTASLAAPRARKTQYVAATTAIAATGDEDLRWVNFRAGRGSTDAF